MSDEPVHPYSAMLRLEEDLDEAIDPLVAYWRAHEAEMPRELARLLERLAEVKADCDRAGMMIRFDPFTGEDVTTEEKPA